jgi:hypothetical protein
LTNPAGNDETGSLGFVVLATLVEGDEGAVKQSSDDCWKFHSSSDDNEDNNALDGTSY